MAKTAHTTTLSRFHNVSDAHLADELGRVDAIVKGAEAELKALKAEFASRGITDVAGDNFVVTATPQVSWRLDTAAVRKHLGEACARFETVSSSTVIRVKAASRFAVAA